MISTDAFSPAVERLDTIVEEEIFAIGAQLWVSHRGRVVCDVALGDAVGGPMATDTVHNQYCVGKPVLALAVARLVQDGRLDPTRPLAEQDLPGWAVPPFPCTVLDVLDHRAGLDTMPAMEWRVAPVEVRSELVAKAIARAQPRPGYSELLGWMVLEEVVRSVTGCADVAREVERLVLAPLGITGMALDPVAAAALAEAGRVSVPFGGLPRRRVPLLFEMLPQSFADLRPAFGILCSAADIGRFLEACRRALAGDDPTGAVPAGALAALLAPRHPPWDDHRTLRRMSMAGGFMVDAATNGIARRASATSFGHNAGLALSLALADPVHELTFALYLNGAEVGVSQAQMARDALVDDVYRAVGA